MKLSRRRLIQLIVAAILVAAFLVGKDHLPHLDLQELLADVSEKLGDWTYLLVGGAAFLETGAFVGLVAPGESVVMIGGAVAGQGEISVQLLIAITWFSAWAGDSVSFLLGGRLGRAFLLRRGGVVGITEERFRRVERYFKRHGGMTILVGRFIGLIRALAPFVAGSSGMRYRAFVPYSILGTGLWSATFCLIGYFASQSLDRAASLAGRGTLLFAITVGVIVGIVAAIRYLRVDDNRRRIVEWMESRPVLRPLVGVGRRVRPQARFLWKRVTPGPLGLQLTTLLAALSVGLFVLVTYTMVVVEDPGPTPGDRTALDLARDIESGWLTAAAKVVTGLGSAWVLVPLAVIAAGVLRARGYRTEFWMLVAGMTIVFLASSDMKHYVDRPRPPGGLIDPPAGSAFPSGHAAHSILYVWLAVTVTTRLRPGWAGGTALVSAGIALAALIGLSRVYLRVHYLSDVIGGWALGVSVFSLCAIVALVGSHLRQNARTHAPSGAREDRA